MKESRKVETVPPSPRATYQDVLNAPPHMVAEVIDGTLYTNPRPDPTHTTASSGLGICVGPPFHFGRGGPGGWWILDQPELHLNQDIVVPDLARISHQSAQILAILVILGFLRLKFARRADTVALSAAKRSGTGHYHLKPAQVAADTPERGHAQTLGV